MTIKDNADYILVLLYSYYTTPTGLGVHRIGTSLGHELRPLSLASDA